MEVEFLTDNSVVKYGFNISAEFIYLPLGNTPSNGLINNCNPHTGVRVSMFEAQLAKLSNFSHILLCPKSLCLNISAEAACSGGFNTSTEVTLLSPGGTSSNYQNNLNCVWTITVPSWYKVRVLQNVFSLTR